jgi:hypothetical protein
VNYKHKKTTVIGLGEMETPIASFLLKADDDVTGFDIVAKRGIHWMDVPLSGPTESQFFKARGRDMLTGNFEAEGVFMDRRQRHCPCS